MMSSALRVLAWGCCSFALVASSRTLTVTTTDNASPSNDNKLSLNEALLSADTGDTIAFNIPGNGPFIIQTPLGGYPFIRADRLTIDGYTQPGSKPNSLAFAEGNNAQIQIILDSTADDTGPSQFAEFPEYIVQRSTRMLFTDGSDIPGYGHTENGILAVLGAKQLTVRGLCFVGRHTAGNTADPSIYAIALARGATDTKIQGCWFGLRPDGQTIDASRAAVTGYRFIGPLEVGGPNVTVFSERLIFGTDGDGVNDRAEANIAMGFEIALALELPSGRISGNHFNVFPNGQTFLDVKAYAEANSLSTIEAYENGRQREGTVIGTNGDGVSDADERNVFAPSKYEHIFETYGGSPATNVVVAGNFVGVGVDGKTVYPFDPPATPDFFQMDGIGSVRIGSNGDGISDALEANVIYALGGSQFVDCGLGVQITARANTLLAGSFSGFPFANNSKNRTYEKYYADVLTGDLTTDAGVLPVITDLLDQRLNGTLPSVNLDNYPYSFVDVYIADPQALANNVVLPQSYVGTFIEGSTQDRDSGYGSFRFPLGAYTIPAGSDLAISVTYSQLPNRTEAGRSITGPISLASKLTDGVVAKAIPPSQFTLRRSRGLWDLFWTGDEGVLRLESTDDLSSGVWTTVIAPSDFFAGKTSIEFSTDDTARRFYRVVFP